MSCLWALLSLSICLLLSDQSLARNDAPCLHSQYNNGYNTFVKRHIRSGIPDTLDHNDWEKYIQNHGGCGRPTQSFLHPRDQENVISICSSQGGKTYKENLCISQQPFNFITVRSQPGTCGIRSVREETKHLIVACEVLDNQCLPVHFEGNPEGRKPDNNAKGCQDPQRAEATGLRVTWLWLLSTVLLLIIYGL